MRKMREKTQEIERGESLNKIKVEEMRGKRWLVKDE